MPPLYKKDGTRYIFIFTPERLISYFANSNPAINYLFVDEAHKLLVEDDTRAPLFYHALMLAKRKSIKLYFASPNIPNTEIFLQLFGNSTDESLSITETSVSQNRFFIDCIDHTATMFSEYGTDINLNYSNYSDEPIDNLNNAINSFGNNNQNIIYCNTVDDTINFALGFSSQTKEKKCDELDSLINLVEQSMHKEYYLIDCLKKGVAFHFGGLPQRIRERIESLFQRKKIDHIFCTSTLLEGVNLPAKNIFILSNSIGIRKISDIDFWNLAGRAGRLTKDLSGNIICMRVIPKRNCWGNPESDIKVLREKKVKNATSSLMNNNRNFYKNIENSIKEVPLTRKKPTENEKKSLECCRNANYSNLSNSDYFSLK